MGDVLPTVVFETDVRAKRAEVDREMADLVKSANACDKLSEDEKRSIGTLQLQWLPVSTRPIGTFGMGADYDEALSYQRQVRDWRDTIRGRCALVGPDPPKPGGLNAKDLAEQWIGLLKIALPAAAVIAVVVLAAPVVWEYTGAKKAKRAA